MPPSPPSSPSSSAATPTPIPASPPSAGDPPPSAAAASSAAAHSPLTALALPAPNPNPNPSSTAKRGLPPPCWSNDETLALIDSYREKWYSLRRGNLRAAHWDEVAADVARRSLHLPGATPKTSVQCRHKIEKLRKRYRSERQRSINHDPTVPPSSPWHFFSKMDLMENPNPTPIPNPNFTPNPLHHHHYHHQNPYQRYRESDDEDDDNEEETEPTFLRRPQIVSNGGLKFKIPKAVRTSRAVPIGNPSPNSSGFNPSSFSKGFVKPGLEEMRRRLEAKRRREEEEEDKGSDAMGEMVRALRMLGEGYMRMEQMKMDMAREMERARMEMELKRTEMILDTQKRIVDSFVKGIVGEKKAKAKRSPGS